MADRKQIDVPTELHERFMEVHEDLRPAVQAPKWYSLELLLDRYESEED